MYMAELRVRNLPEDIKLMLKEQVSRQGQNLEMYLREVLSEQALRGRREWADRLKAQRDDFHEKYGLFSDSALMIREERDSRR
jgi:plasmid stability protein